MKKVQPEISPLMEELSSYIAGAIKKPLPPEVVERAKVHLVDTFAAIISGSRLLPGKKASAYVRSQGGKPVASVFGSRIVTSAPNAAFANGMCAHADETDDCHPTTRTHPGSGTVPAVIAISERDRLTGTAALRAMVLGYDIGARLILAITEHHFRNTGHQPSIFARLFSAAVAAGALLKLDKRQVRYLMSYTAQQAAGMATVLRDTEHIEKAFVSGMPPHNGVTAALVVEQGFTGVEDVFSGKHNFFSTFAPEADLTQMTRGLGREYEIMRAVIKRWSTGGPTQAPLNVLYALMKEHGFKAGDVQKLTVWIRPTDLVTVASSEMANISLQYSLAVMLLDGTMTFKSTHDYARMKNPKILAERKKIEVLGDPALTGAQRGWRCAMEITLQDGRKLTHQMTPAKGNFESPLAREDENEKALDLIAPVIGNRRTQELLTLLWNFDRVKDVRAVRKLVST